MTGAEGCWVYAIVIHITTIAIATCGGEDIIQGVPDAAYTPVAILSSTGLCQAEGVVDHAHTCMIRAMY